MTKTLRELDMSDDEFELLRNLIQGHCGIYFGDDSRYLLEKRLLQRVAHLGLATFGEYHHYLAFNRNRDQELAEIMDVLTTNETYFFREPCQLKAFTDEVLPELIRRKTERGERTLRIWSAGCSTGEEPYTIAMLVHGMPQLAGWDVSIVGTDISQKVLKHAREAVYGASAFRATGDENLKRYFHRQESRFRIDSSIRDRVTIYHLNLFDTPRLAMLGRMDVVFCRNVIIYFDQAARKKVIESFHTVLHDGGYLLLGHSESLVNISTSFTLRHFENDMVYQKGDRSGGEGT